MLKQNNKSQTRRFIWLMAISGLLGLGKANAQGHETSPQVKIDTIVAKQKSDFGQRGAYNQLDNSITLYRYVLESIPSVWRDNDLGRILEDYNNSLPFSLQHEEDHARVEHISKFGFSSNQIIQFNILREVSALIAEMRKARSAFLLTQNLESSFHGLKSSYVVMDNYIDGYVGGVALYYDWLKVNGGRISEIPSSEEISLMLTAATKAFSRKFPTAYAQDIGNLSVRDMKFYGGLNLQKATMPPEDFARYLDRLKIGYMKVIAVKEPVSYDDAVRLMFTHRFGKYEICLMDECDDVTKSLLRESVLKMMNNRALQKICSKHKFADYVAEAFRKHKNFPNVAIYDYAPIQIKHEYYIQGLER